MTTIYQQNAKPIETNNRFNLTTSDKYNFIDSKDIIKTFQDQGFILDGTSSSNVRNKDKQGFQKHMMIFSRPDLIVDGDNKLQLLATNSHDGSSSLKLNVGIYRAICANGLVSGDSLLEQRVRHIGNIQEQLKESMIYMASNIDTIKAQVNAMKAYQLSFDESQKLIKNAVDYRLQNVSNLLSVDLSTVDKLRRDKDQGQDLYTVFNRIQESILRGGVEYKRESITFDDNGNKKHSIQDRTSRGIKGIKESIDTNKFLWNSALELVS